MKRSVLAILLIGILVLSGCKATKEETVASVAGFVPEAETQGAEELKKESEILPSEPPKEEKKEPSQEQEPLKEDTPKEDTPKKDTPKEESPKEEIPREETDEPAPQPTRNLTLEDVITLSEKGKELSYKDFEIYFYEETAKGFLREYQIDERYQLQIHFNKESKRTESILLIANDNGPNGLIDVRSGEVAQFAEERKKYQPLAVIPFEQNVTSGSAMSFYDFYEYAEQYGSVEYYTHVDKIARGCVLIKTLEDYLKYAGENPISTYDAAFFEKNALFLFDVSYGSGGYSALNLRVGKQGETLYVAFTSGAGVCENVCFTCDMKYEFYRLTIPKEQLDDTTEAVMFRQFLEYRMDPFL
ncbi:MAG: hypothetical protein IJN82_02200 [Clostridia bacterium]|nr:hypothetical protein [Clostridia bacterium]